MVDSQTYQSLVEACSLPGCPVCTMIQDSVERSIEAIFYESILDPVSRQQLRESCGLCNEHANLALQAGLSDVLGYAILYEDILATILQDLPENSGRSKDERRGLIRKLNPSKPCPGCSQKEEIEPRAISALVASLPKNDFKQIFQKSNGLCLAHLRDALEEISNADSAGFLLDHQRQVGEKLKTELKEFIRKNDYRFRDEAFGEERDSYRRAMELVVGKIRYKPE